MDYNNFHEYFPGGANRRFLDDDAYPKTDRTRQIVASLDSILEQERFDLPAFQRLIERKSRMWSECRELFSIPAEQRALSQDSKQKEKALERESKKVWEEINAMLQPI